MDFHFYFRPRKIESGWWKLAGFDVVKDGLFWVLKQTGNKYRDIEGAYTDVRVIYFSMALTVEKIEIERRKGSET